MRTVVATIRSATALRASATQAPPMACRPASGWTANTATAWSGMRPVCPNNARADARRSVHSRKSSPPESDALPSIAIPDQDSGSIDFALLERLELVEHAAPDRTGLALAYRLAVE